MSEPTIHFVEDYEQLTGESTEAATKRLKETKVVTAAADSDGDKKTTDKAETK